MTKTKKAAKPAKQTKTSILSTFSERERTQIQGAINYASLTPTAGFPGHSLLLLVAHLSLPLEWLDQGMNERKLERYDDFITKKFNLPPKEEVADLPEVAELVESMKASQPE